MRAVEKRLAFQQTMEGGSLRGRAGPPFMGSLCSTGGEAGRASESWKGLTSAIRTGESEEREGGGEEGSENEEKPKQSEPSATGLIGNGREAARGAADTESTETGEG